MRISGLTSGLDWEDLVLNLMAIERRPLLMLQDRMDRLERARTEWQSLNRTLLNLRTASEALGKAALWDRMATSSTDTSVATASATVSATQATYALTVEQLAQSHRVVSNQVADTGAALGLVGTFEINGTALAVGAGDSLADIRDSINAEGAGVTAVLIDGRLVLTSTTTGVEGQMVFDDIDGLLDAIGVLDPANEIREAADARFALDGLLIERGANSFSDVVEGVTINLEAVGSSSITIDSDRDAIKSAVTQFINLYNDTLGRTEAAHRHETGEPLAGDNTLRRLIGDLRSIPGYPAASLSGEGVQTLNDVGVKRVGTTGRLQLSEAEFWAAWESDRDAVKSLFVAEDSPVERLAQRLDYVTRTGGLISGLERSIGRQMRDVSIQAERMEIRLEKRQNTLFRQFQTLESMMSAMQTQSAWLTQQLNMVSGFGRRDS